MLTTTTPGLTRLERVVVQALGGLRPRRLGLDHDIGVFDEAVEQVAARLQAELAGDGALAGVHGPPVEAGVGAGLVLEVGAVLAGAVAAARFDLDDVGAELGHEPGAELALLVGQVEHAVAGKGAVGMWVGDRSGRCHLVGVLPVRGVVFNGPVGCATRHGGQVPARATLWVMAKTLHKTAQQPEQAYLVAADTPGALLPVHESLAELAELARTAGAEVVGSSIQKLRSPHPATYIGKGKLEEVVSAAHEAGATTVVFDEELSPSQQRNLERALGTKVLDRTALILDIFATRASTREGKLQVQLAQMQYLLPRLAGQWQHLERMEGAIGTRGPGETQIETDRRLVRGRIAKIRRDLEQVRQQRSQRRQRRSRNGMPVVSLVGYTNAGKSTLMQALSGSDVFTEDRLFATLDTLTRKVRLPAGETVLLTDTVGFIQKLPTDLVAAFRATLEELEEADVLVHVVDISHPSSAQQVQAVNETLQSLDVLDRPTIVALNKVDRVRDPEGELVRSYEAAERAVEAAGEQPANVVLVSAQERWGLEELRSAIELALDGGFEVIGPPEEAAAGPEPADGLKWPSAFGPPAVGCADGIPCVGLMV
ncbi:MAG: GTPase HflX [Dehalococcoidia bacterium]|nr:GTPase HflX [Dehalococcoidia bacterium]